MGILKHSSFGHTNTILADTPEITPPTHNKIH
jgi:hypothetical protein